MSWGNRAQDSDLAPPVPRLASKLSSWFSKRSLNQENRQHPYNLGFLPDGAVTGPHPRLNQKQGLRPSDLCEQPSCLLSSPACELSASGLRTSDDSADGDHPKLMIS